MAADRTAPALPAHDASDVIQVAARAYEIDRYLASLLAPKAARADLMSLAAFAGEIARIPAYVSEPMMGEIRLAWWREQLEAAILGATTGHPIADTLADVCRRRGLTSGFFLPLIEARTRELEAAPMADAAALDAYVAAVDGTLFYAAARCLGAAPADAERALIDQAAWCYGLARVLVEAPALAAQGRTLLPRDRLVAHGIDGETLGGADAHARLQPVLAELGSTVAARYQALRPLLNSARPPVRLAVLPVVLTGAYVRCALAPQRRASGDILPITRVCRLWLAARMRILPQERRHSMA